MMERHRVQDQLLVVKQVQVAVELVQLVHQILILVLVDLEVMV